MMLGPRTITLVLLVTVPLWGQVPAPGPISVNQLRGDLSFLASDTLAGRYTPSPGLEVAAEFIASRFRAIGLRPLADGTYFQSAAMIDRTLPKPTDPLRFFVNGQAHTVAIDDYSILNVAAALRLNDAPVVLIASLNAETIPQMDLKGKVVLIAHSSRHISRALQSAGAAALVIASKSNRLHSHPLLFEAAHDPHAMPVLSVQSEFLAGQLSNPTPAASWTFTANLPGSEDHPVTLHNVAGVIPGSDPVLKKQFVMITAHYDHVGSGDTASPFAMTPPTPTDQIYNGADDDGSGTVSVIALAQSLMRAHPKRSIVCMTFFGEERGLIGSEYYAAHPLFPAAQTVVDINLEQVGRIDEVAKDKITRLPLTLKPTGYTYSNLAEFVRKAGVATGVQVYQDKEKSDEYFVASDNASLSALGIPSASFSTAFEFSDYHGVGDEWQKIDYPNMARVDRTLALAALLIANSAAPPQWNKDNSKTATYRKAKEHAKAALFQ